MFRSTFSRMSAWFNTESTTKIWDTPKKNQVMSRFSDAPLSPNTISLSFNVKLTNATDTVEVESHISVNHNTVNYDGLRPDGYDWSSQCGTGKNLDAAVGNTPVCADIFDEEFKQNTQAIDLTQPRAEGVKTLTVKLPDIYKAIMNEIGNIEGHFNGTYLETIANPYLMDMPINATVFYHSATGKTYGPFPICLEQLRTGREEVMSSLCPVQSSILSRFIAWFLPHFNHIERCDEGGILDGIFNFIYQSKNGTTVRVSLPSNIININPQLKTLTAATEPTMRKVFTDIKQQIPSNIDDIVAERLLSMNRNNQLLFNNLQAQPILSFTASENALRHLGPCPSANLQTDVEKGTIILCSIAGLAVGGAASVSLSICISTLLLIGFVACCKKIQSHRRRAGYKELNIQEQVVEVAKANEKDASKALNLKNEADFKEELDDTESNPYITPRKNTLTKK